MNLKVVATTPATMGVVTINNQVHPLTKRENAIIVCIELPSMSVSSLSARIVEPIL
jgi:hypothetical protein